MYASNIDIKQSAVQSMANQNSVGFHGLDLTDVIAMILLVEIFCFLMTK